MEPILYSIGSVLLVSLVSLIGVIFVGVKHERLNRWLFILIAFAVGGLLGDVFIHILPEVMAGEAAFLPTALIMILVGIVLSFIVEKFIHWRHCHRVDCPTHVKPLGTMVILGDAAHNITDGLLIATSFLVSVPAGIATTLAVILHEIPQEIGDFSVLLYSGYTKTQALLVNLLTALTALIGAVFVLTLQSTLPNLEAYLFPLVAGNFLYIAIADLLPELHKQTRVRDSLMQLIGAGAGIALMYLLTFLE